MIDIRAHRRGPHSAEDRMPHKIDGKGYQATPESFAALTLPSADLDDVDVAPCFQCRCEMSGVPGDSAIRLALVRRIDGDPQRPISITLVRKAARVEAVMGF